MWADFTETLGVIERENIKHHWFKTIITVPLFYNVLLIWNSILDIPIANLPLLKHQQGTISALHLRDALCNLCRPVWSLPRGASAVNTPRHKHRTLYMKTMSWTSLMWFGFGIKIIGDFNFFFICIFISQLFFNEHILLLQKMFWKKERWYLINSRKCSFEVYFLFNCPMFWLVDSFYLHGKTYEIK